MSRLFFYFLFFFLPWYGIAQEMQFTTPIKLEPSVNSESEELMPLLTSDGQMLYFSRVLHSSNTGGGEAGQDIWVSHKTETGWTNANNNFPKWNNSQNNAIVGMSPDGKTVYLLNTYNRSARKNKGLAFSRLNKGVWTEPEVISIKGIESLGHKGFYMSPTYDVLFISMEGIYGKEDLFVSFKNDKTGLWQKPINLGPSINTSGFEFSPFLSEDRKTLYFSSDGHEGFGGSDVFMSQRLYDSWEVWSIPKNLGTAINTDKFDAYFSLSDSIAHFVSNREGNSADIFSTTILEKKDNSNKELVDQLLKEAASILGDLQENVSDKIIADYKFMPFDFNSSELGNKARIIADRFIEKIQRNEIIEIVATGNDLSDEALNEELSFSRYEALKYYLLEKGIDKNQILFSIESREFIDESKSGVYILLLK